MEKFALERTEVGFAAAEATSDTNEPTPAHVADTG